MRRINRLLPDRTDAASHAPTSALTASVDPGGFNRIL
jgi:hypothetical protein